MNMASCLPPVVSQNLASISSPASYGGPVRPKCWPLRDTTFGVNDGWFKPSSLDYCSSIPYPHITAHHLHPCAYTLVNVCTQSAGIKHDCARAAAALSYSGLHSGRSCSAG